MPEPEETVEEQPDDSRSVLEAAYDEAENDEEPETEVAVEPENTAAPEEVPAEAAPEATEEPETPAEEDSTPEAIDAPTHWSVEHQEMFRGLDGKAQSFLMDRSREMEAAHTKRSQEIAPLRNASERWAPYLNQIQAEPSQVFDSLMQYEYGLRTGTNEQRMNILVGLARDYGVSFGNGGQEAPSAEEDPFGFQTQIKQAVEPLNQQISQITGNIQQNQYAQQQSGVATAQQSIDAFQAEKGADGKPAHPYFAEAYNEMLALAQAKSSAGQPLDIAQLYDSACWSNPSTRAKIQAAENYKTQQTQRKAEQERAAKAKTAAGSLAGGGGGGKEQPTSVRETLEAAWEAAS